MAANRAVLEEMKAVLEEVETLEKEKTNLKLKIKRLECEKCEEQVRV